MRKIGITGGSGFIGTHVIRELINKKYIPVVFDRHKKIDYPKECEIFVGNVCDETSTMELASHVDGIIHLAACLGTQETIDNPIPSINTNILGGINVIESSCHYKIPMVNIAVGNWWMNNPYSITKNTIERFIKMYNKERNGKINVLRVVNAYGPYQEPFPPYGVSKVRKITPSFICKSLCGDDIEIYGDGSQVSDMVYVKDVATALVKCLEKSDAGHIFDDPIEIGPKTHTSVLDFANIILQNCQSKMNTKSSLKFLPMRPGESVGKNVIADVRTLSKIDISTDELTPLVDGVNFTVDYYMETFGKKWGNKK